MINHSVSDFSEYWSVSEGMFFCLFDRKRTAAFKRAIKKAVRNGDIVVDAGSGSGILAMFAADAGARRVFAVEFDDNNARALPRNLAANGYDDRIEVIHADAATVQLPEKVDVVICEMIGTGLIDERQVPVMNNILSQVNPGFRVVLEQYHCHAELVEHKNHYYGKNFDIVRHDFVDKPSLRSIVRSNRQLYKIVDFRQPVLDNSISAHLEFTTLSTGIVNGLRIGAMTHLHGGGVFERSVAYSDPIILPLNEFEVVDGDRIVINLNYRMCEGLGNLHYSVES